MYRSIYLSISSIVVQLINACDAKKNTQPKPQLKLNQKRFRSPPLYTLTWWNYPKAFTHTRAHSVRAMPTALHFHTLIILRRTSLEHMKSKNINNDDDDENKTARVWGKFLHVECTQAKMFTRKMVKDIIITQISPRQRKSNSVEHFFFHLNTRGIHEDTAGINRLFQGTHTRRGTDTHAECPRENQNTLYV